VLTPEGVTAVDLASLLAVALDAYAKQKTADTIADDVEQRAPRFTGLRDHLRTGPGQADAVGWLIAVIIPVLVAVLSALLKPPTVIDVHVDEPPVVVQPVPSRDEIERVVEEKLRELQHDRTSEPHQSGEGGRATHVPHDPAHDGQ
jgi:hypothetical protein